MSFPREQQKGKRPDVTVQAKMMAAKKMAPMKKAAAKKTMPKKKM